MCLPWAASHRNTTAPSDVYKRQVYHGLQDIPKEHKVFSFPKLSIRAQMAAYQEIIDGSSLEGYRQMQKKDRGDR